MPIQLNVGYPYLCQPKTIASTIIDSFTWYSSYNCLSSSITPNYSSLADVTLTLQLAGHYEFYLTRTNQVQKDLLIAFPGSNMLIYISGFIYSSQGKYRYYNCGYYKANNLFNKLGLCSCFL